MNLNVLICAFEDGIIHLSNSLPQEKPNIKFFISYQGRPDYIINIPESIQNRKDVEIEKLPGLGLSKNRNNVVRMALDSKSEGYFLIADDDVIFKQGIENIIINSFKKHPSSDILCFKVETLNSNRSFKDYSSYIKKISWRNIDQISSIEITGKMEVLKNITFDERLGLGSTFPSGEETAFLADALRLSYKILFIPKFIVCHPFETSGKSRENKYTKETLHLIGARAYRIYGKWRAGLFFILSALKNHPKYKSQFSIVDYLKFLMEGVHKFKISNG